MNEQSVGKEIQLRWKTETKEVSEDVKVDEIIDFLKEAGYEETDKDDSKGWIYEITYTDADGDEHKMVIVDEKKLTYDGKIYECDGIDLSFFDEASGFDREN